MRNVFVGALFAIGFFLFCYRGYETRDDVAGNLAGLFALGVALFPTSDPVRPIMTTGDTIHRFHLASAISLFLMLAYFSIFLFTKTEQGGCLFQCPKIRKTSCPNGDKLNRNRIYFGSGLFIIVCMVAILIYVCFWKESRLAKYDRVYWLESGMLLAFGFSWFVKGETL